MPAIARSTVKALHQDIDKALVQVAKKHGFTYLPAGLRFTDLDIKGQILFVLDGKEQQLVQARTGHLAIGDLKIGERVSIVGKADYVTYTIEKFTPQGGSHIVRDSDGKRFRCPQTSLVKKGATAPAALEHATDCPECKQKKYVMTGSRRAGPELAIQTWKCMGCGHTEQEPID